MKTNNKLTRRQFTSRAVAAAASVSIVPRHVIGKGETPPSEIVTKAVIGVGGMGMGHLKGVNPKAKLVAVCDVDENHLKRAQKEGGKDVRAYKDFREVLEQKDVDVVHVPTPPHWHALISIAAAKAGKDIWCEKPLSRTIYEGEKPKTQAAKLATTAPYLNSPNVNTKLLCRAILLKIFHYATRELLE